MRQLEKYQSALQTEKEQLTKQLEKLGVKNPLNENDWVPIPEASTGNEADENVAADRSESWQNIRGTLEELETRLQNINRALQKMTDGKYGICEISNEEIEDDRLEANPAARTCKAHINDEQSLPL